MSNRVFSPSTGSPSVNPDNPPSPEFRKGLPVHAHGSKSFVGRPLTSVDTPWELFCSVAQAMLGWLAMLQSGFLHQDITIENVLVCDEPIEMPKFSLKVPNDLVVDLETISLADTTTDSENPSVTFRRDLMTLLDDLEISENCRAFIVDLDTAAPLRTMTSANDDNVHLRTRSGTRQFMSKPLSDSLKFSELYLQSPVDDLCSFYYVGQWAALFNQRAEDQNRTLSPRFLDLRNSVGGSAPERYDATTKIGKIPLDEYLEAYPPFLVRCAPTLQKWFASVDRLVNNWKVAKAPGRKLVGKEAHKFYVPLFFQFAYRGVKEYLEILKEDAKELAKAL
ncbi:hypothetical protein ONZ45_g10946 [Pleurotus djamor]|nr:hypothetical protein ONZ45_g10946 [Pleurotus djamor]